MASVFDQLADAFTRRKLALAEKDKPKTKLAGSDYFMPKSSKEDLAQQQRILDIEGLPGVLKEGASQMYHNPIVNTAIGFTPVVGDIQAAGETMAALERGAPWQETAGYAVGMLPFVPALRTTWHGSPHGFTKFDMSKIGTGEGAQAYGHGLYLAESPNVATEYSKMEGMVQPPPRRMFQGVELTPGTPEYHAGTLLERSTLPAARKEVAGWIKEAETWPAARKADPREMDVLAGWQKTLDTLNQTAKKSDFSVAKGGYLYKVDLPDEQIAKMLDWDKPLSEQAPEVLEALQTVDLTAVNPRVRKLIEQNRADGQTIYKAFGGYENPAAASARLNELGIPGIQYLDQGSRGAGEGTRNYVVFSDEIPKILERNNQPIK